ncbi:serine O-acetyltransferase [Klebsiella michiganensis]|uniref:serine O-acetyltransferase n=1 Tax=Klebsiella michiganensis TaxID=1134687 RepID=UPI003F4F8C2F
MRLVNYAIFPDLTATNTFWIRLYQEAKDLAEQGSAMTKLMQNGILKHTNFGEALASRLSLKLANGDINEENMKIVVGKTLQCAPCIIQAALADMQAVYERDPACHSTVQVFFFFKGYLALQAHRIAHYLYNHHHPEVAYHIQNRCSEMFGIDIHPAAQLGKGIMFDHTHGIVIGETAVVGDNVSVLHGVTLGATNQSRGDRHPKIGNRVIIGAGAKILGNVKIGEGCYIGAGAVVLEEMPPFSIAVGIPARTIQNKINHKP